MSKHDYEDAYLINMIYEKNEDAESLLYKVYYDLIKYKAYKYVYIGRKVGLDIEDLIQEGYIGLSQAILDFRDDREAIFSTFANLCIEREIQSCILKAQRKKHSILNESFSIDQEVVEGSDLSQVISTIDASPDLVVLSMLSEKKDLKKIFAKLTAMEKKVFILKYKGFNYQEIAKIMNKQPKAIDNAIQRIKRKVGHAKDVI